MHKKTIARSDIDWLPVGNRTPYRYVAESSCAVIMDTDVQFIQLMFIASLHFLLTHWHHQLVEVRVNVRKILPKGRSRLVIP